MLSVVVAGLGIANITSVFEANEPDSKDALQDLSKYTAADYCAGRCDSCNVKLDIPEGCAGAATTQCHIALCLHGNEGKSDQGSEICGEEIHKRGNFIGVYPEGCPLQPGVNGGQWNDGEQHYPGPSFLTCAYDQYTCKDVHNPADVDFMAKVYAAVKGAGVTGKLTVMGESRGSIQALRTAASAGPTLPVIAVAGHAAAIQDPVRSGPGVLNYNSPVTATPHVAYMWVVPEDDKYANYLGGPKFTDENFSWKSGQESAATWAVHNGCANATTTDFSTWKLVQGGGAAKYKGLDAKVNALHAKVNALTEPRVTEQTGLQGKITHYKFTGCSAKAPVEYFLAEKGTHEKEKKIGSKMWMELAFDMFDKVSKL